MTPVMTIRPSAHRGFVVLGGTIREPLHAQLREWPGAVCRWNARQKSYVWEAPAEFRSKLQDLAHDNGVHPDIGICELRRLFKIEFEDARPYQTDAVRAALESNSYMLCFEMGMGKTRTAIECLKDASDTATALIVCPASVRSVWEDELKKWWPEIGREVALFLPGFKQSGFPRDCMPGCRIFITSYEMLKTVAPMRKWDAIILDESQYISNGGKNGAQRTKLVHQLRRDNPRSFRLALTATPIYTDPKQLHSQWEWLFPGRLGSWYDFTHRYCQVVDTGWTTASGNAALQVFGVNKDYLDELKFRLSFGMARATKKEWAHLLPPLITQTLRIDRPAGFNPRELVDRFLRSDLHRVDSEEFIRLHSANKISVAANHAIEALGNTSHVCVLTYLHVTAHLIETELAAAAIPVTCVTGEMNTQQRKQAIDAAKAAPRNVLIASMTCVSTGIDLTKFSCVYFAELYSSPGLMEQVAGRFHRLNSQEPVNIYLLVINGSYEEKVAAKLKQRLDDNKGIVDESMTAGAITDSFTDKRSDEEFRDHLNDLLGGMHDDTELGGYL